MLHSLLGLPFIEIERNTKKLISNAHKQHDKKYKPFDKREKGITLKKRL